VREGALLAVPFDLAKLEVTGGAVGVVSDVMQAGYLAGLPNDTGVMQASVSATGTLVYLPGGIHPPTDYQVHQLDRSGRGEPLPIPPHDFRTLRISPDGTSMVLASVGRDRGLWLYGFARGTFGRLASAGPSLSPIWTRDGQRVAYAIGTSADTLHWTRADGRAPSELLIKSPLNLVPAAWAPGDQTLLYYAIAGSGAAAVWSKDLGDSGEPRAVVGTMPQMGGVDLSPDGRWLAYHTTESGEQQVYVEAFPGPGPRIQISSTGGGSPVWRADGRELFYARPSSESQPRNAGEFDVALMAVAVTPGPTTVSLGQTRQLFAGRYSMNNPDRGFDVSPDGQRFLMLQARRRAPDVITEMIVVQNWIEELKRLARTR
jgi:serine/threonine-protein kinase